MKTCLSILILMLSAVALAGPPTPKSGIKWLRLKDTSKDEQEHCRQAFECYSQVLAEEKMDSTVTGILNYLKEIQPRTVPQKDIDAHIRQLGAESAKDRNKAAMWLQTIGITARESLLKAAKSSDPEIKRRAQELADRIHGKTFQKRFAAAAGLMLRYRPKGGTKLLMAFLTDKKLAPETRAFAAQAAILCADKADTAFLTKVAESEGMIETRIVAVQALAKVYGEKRKGNLHRFLKKTVDSRIRFAAAECAAYSCDEEGVPVLIDLLAGKDSAIAVAASDLLCRLTGRSFRVGAKDSLAVRKAIADVWRLWFKENRKTVRLCQQASPSRSPLELLAIFPDAMVQRIRKMTMLPHFVDQDDDTLAVIAEMYGSKVTWIKMANPGIQTDADLRTRKEINVPVEDLDGGE